MSGDNLEITALGMEQSMAAKYAGRLFLANYVFHFPEEGGCYRFDATRQGWGVNHIFVLFEDHAYRAMGFPEVPDFLPAPSCTDIPESIKNWQMSEIIIPDDVLDILRAYIGLED